MNKKYFLSLCTLIIFNFSLFSGSKSDEFPVTDTRTIQEKIKTRSIPNQRVYYNGYTENPVGESPYCGLGHIHFVGSYGNHIFSNHIEGSSKILTCFSGSVETKCIANIFHNPLAMLDLRTGINKPYKAIPELHNKTAVSAIHLLDSKTPVVGHANNIYIFEEESEKTDSWLKKMFNSSGEKLKLYSLRTKQTLAEVIPSRDTFDLIDSRNSLFIAISKAGLLTTWQKNKSEIDVNSKTQVKCPQQHFSCAVNQQHKIICLGLTDGNIFIASVADLNNNKIISLFPFSNATVNWIHSRAGMLFFGALHDCEKNKCLKEFCCKKHGAPAVTTCPNCMTENKQKIYSKQIAGSLNTIDLEKQKLEKELSDLNKQMCPHIQEQLDILPDICDHCIYAQNVFDTPNAFVLASDLIENLNTKNIQPIMPRNSLRIEDIKALLTNEKETWYEQLLLKNCSIAEVIILNKDNIGIKINTKKSCSSDYNKQMNTKTGCVFMIMPIKQNNVSEPKGRVEHRYSTYNNYAPTWHMIPIDKNGFALIDTTEYNDTSKHFSSISIYSKKDTSVSKSNINKLKKALSKFSKTSWNFTRNFVYNITPVVLVCLCLKVGYDSVSIT
jgi:hypothetical protein